MENEVRVRFAPSPTGYLHVGGLRTALYNYLFAKHNNGKMVLRIEDTDRSRFVENATENLIKSLEWAGIEFDESIVKGGQFGPYIQSERLKLYKDYTKKLLESGKAYYAFDSADDLAQMRQRTGDTFDPKYRRQEMKNQFTIGEQETKKLISDGVEYVVRLFVPLDETIEFTDVIRGEISVNTHDIDDQVLLKSDGYPTYHLANVVDDYLMKISHVIRGEEWLPSTPKHVLLYKSFGWEPPIFAHLPLLLNKDKSKLSKRQGSVAVEDYIKKGYLRDAFVNFIALLGWNPTGDREIYSIDELIQYFKLEKVNKAGAVFDIQKLEWMNHQYIKQTEPIVLGQMLLDELENHRIDNFDINYTTAVANLFKERVNFVYEIYENNKYMFFDKFDYENEYFQKKWKDDTLELIKPLIEIYKNTDNFAHSELYDITKQYAESKSLKIGDIIHPIRIMITGKSVGAGMFETMEIIGKEKCINRFDKFINVELKELQK